MESRVAFNTADKLEKVWSANISWTTKTKKKCGKKEPIAKGFEKPSMTLAIAGYISYMFLFCVGWIREFLFGLGPVTGKNVKKFRQEEDRQDYAPLYDSFESFYTRNVYRRMKWASHQPIASCPGAKVTRMHRVTHDDNWTFELEGSTQECVNFTSYNYLGFAENDGKSTQEAIDEIRKSGLTMSSPRHELGTSKVNAELDKIVAEFLGVEDAITMGMGFATNTLNLPVLLGKGCLVISDERNHASIILGIRLSGATVAVFKHNNIDHMEKVLRSNIIKGQPRTRRPWRKVVIVVEGIYSMEGTIVKLPEIIAIKKKYGAYLYLDEAHSVGAMGSRGRGVVDYYGLNAQDVDVLMGTFTKSFGSCGGYIAGSAPLIAHLRKYSQAYIYSTSVSPPVARQVIASMNAIMDPRGDGLERVQRLARNSRYFRQRLQQLGFIVYGHDDSPVIPLMLFMPAKIGVFIHEMLKHNIAAIAVAFPATKITEERARFCVSASHTKEMLDYCLDALDQVGDFIHIKYSQRSSKLQKKTIQY